MKGTSDNKSEENRPPLKLHFKGGLFLIQVYFSLVINMTHGVCLSVRLLGVELRIRMWETLNLVHQVDK